MKSTDKAIQTRALNLSNLNTYVCERDSDFGATLEPFRKVLNAEEKTLIITDPFLFSNGEEESYYQNLSTLLKKLKCKEILDVSNKNKRFQDVANLLQRDQIDLCNIKIDAKIHDRFWICPESKKGFSTGTSLNGFAKSLSLINPILDEDLNGILDFLKRKNVVWKNDPA